MLDIEVFATYGTLARKISRPQKQFNNTILVIDVLNLTVNEVFRNVHTLVCRYILRFGICETVIIKCSYVTLVIVR